MMIVKFKTENAAFDGGKLAIETARILCNIAARVEAGHTDGWVLDANGNRVGEWSLDLSEDCN